MANWLSSLLALFGLLAVCVSGSMDLYLLNNTNPNTPQGPACLDGTAPGYWMKQGDPSSWVIWFQGGGWCYKESDCAGRALTNTGSSAQFTPTMDVGGLLSEDPSVNPDFYDWTHVALPYCDGASWTGNVDHPVVVGNQKLYFRGWWNLHAVFQQLASIGLGQAKNVILTGCSAGGLSSFLHADTIAGYLSSSAKFRVAPGSGFFMEHANVKGNPVYSQQMANVFSMHNSSIGVPEECLALHPNDPWRCLFAENLFPTVDTPVFIMNSAYDGWSLRCIFGAEPVSQSSANNGNCSAVPGWRRCFGKNWNCTQPQLDFITEEWHDNFIATWQRTEAYKKPGNGAFITSCAHHCAEVFDYWNTNTVEGSSYAQAFSKWWAAPEGSPASDHTYQDCSWGQNMECNPTCL